MNMTSTPQRRNAPPARPPQAHSQRGGSRRGSVYVLVLGLATMSMVIGTGAVVVSRLGTRTTAENRDWSEATALAMSGVEAAIARMNTDLTWRLSLISGAESPPISLGRGTAQYRVVDESDNDLSLGLLGPVRIYGAGSSGRAKRYFSAIATPQGGPAPTSLQCAAYAAGAISCSGSTAFSGGPLASAATLTVNLLASVSGSVEAAAVVNLGSVSGSTTLLAPARSMPSAGVLELYEGTAAAIPFSSISSGTIDRIILSSGNNPWGSPNARGVYAIDVPAGSTLRIRRSRLAATLVVSLGLGSTLAIEDSVLWEPVSQSAPLLIAGSASLATVNISLGSASLDEGSSNTNYNPVHTPYLGVSDGDTTDIYPSQMRGLIHVVGAATTTNIQSNSQIVGAVISEGTLNIGGGATISLDPALYASPPEGYSTNYGRMSVVRGSWRWETALP